MECLNPSLLMFVLTKSTLFMQDDFLTLSKDEKAGWKNSYIDGELKPLVEFISLSRR